MLKCLYIFLWLKMICDCTLEQYEQTTKAYFFYLKLSLSIVLGCRIIKLKHCDFSRKCYCLADAPWVKRQQSEQHLNMDAQCISDIPSMWYNILKGKCIKLLHFIDHFHWCFDSELLKYITPVWVLLLSDFDKQHQRSRDKWSVLI